MLCICNFKCFVTLLVIQYFLKINKIFFGQNGHEKLHQHSKPPADERSNSCIFASEIILSFGNVKPAFF